ncbi:MAG: hypothetical protein ACR2GH_07090 [Pseudonocardia sp.]
MADTTSIANLLEALRVWLLANPNGDLKDFAAENGCTVEDLADSWNTYFTQSADFSRNYNIDTTQSGAVYTPAPPPHGASHAEYREYLVQEVNNYQEFTTINNIEDNSINNQIFAGGDVELNQNTGDLDEGAVLQQGEGNVANTGDMTNSGGSAGSVFGRAETIGSGNTNFGDGQQGVNASTGNNARQANQQQDNDVNVETGDTTGGDGGDGDGGNAGGGLGVGIIGVGVGGTGGDGDGGNAGDADSNTEIDIETDNSQSLDQSDQPDMTP